MCVSVDDARNEGGSLSRLAPSVMRVVICMSRAFCLTDQRKRETAHSLDYFVKAHIWDKINVKKSLMAFTFIFTTYVVQFGHFSK